MEKWREIIQKFFTDDDGKSEMKTYHVKILNQDKEWVTFKWSIRNGEEIIIAVMNKKTTLTYCIVNDREIAYGKLDRVLKPEFKHSGWDEFWNTNVTIDKVLKSKKVPKRVKNEVRLSIL